MRRQPVHIVVAQKVRSHGSSAHQMLPARGCIEQWHQSRRWSMI